MQGMGSAITYARRYSLASVFCITQEDDDGNGTVKTQGAVAEKPTQAASTKNPPSLGDYVIPIGKDYRGKKLKEVAKADLSGFVAWLETDAIKKGQKLDGHALEFATKAKAYVAGASA